MTQVFKKTSDWRAARRNLEGTIGFVPTMGALHQGHLELIKKSKAENDLTVVSIFVNPTQFNDKNDFEKYPVTYETDLALLNKVQTDYLFYPNFNEIYPDDYRYKITESKLSKILCGQHRPGHFDGALTVVMKLFNIIQPNRAYFGEKDFQQFQLVKDMTTAFCMDLEVISIPTVREESGLALSSRNVRLTAEGKSKAVQFAKILTSTKPLSEIRSSLESQSIEIEYLEEHFGRRFAAVHIDGVRLIDNIKCEDTI